MLNTIQRNKKIGNTSQDFVQLQLSTVMAKTAKPLNNRNLPKTSRTCSNFNYFASVARFYLDPLLKHALGHQVERLLLLEGAERFRIRRVGGQTVQPGQIQASEVRVWRQNDRHFVETLKKKELK
jgi:hypothetical protein